MGEREKKRREERGNGKRRRRMKRREMSPGRFLGRIYFKMGFYFILGTAIKRPPGKGGQVWKIP